MNNTCTICGSIRPEWQQICPICASRANKNYKESQKEKCKYCGSTNITYTSQMVSKGVVVKNISIARTICRAFMVLCTCGLWLLVPKKKETHKIKNRIVMLCSCKDCNKAWEK